MKTKTISLGTKTTHSHQETLAPLSRIQFSIILFILCLNFSQSMAQSFQSSSNCPEHNAFYNNSDLERVKALVSRITHDGAIYLNPDKSDSLEFVFQRMGIQSSSTFSRTFETRSRLDTTKYFERFQQYYNSVKVEGGGYTLAFFRPGGPGPCLEAPYMLVPYIKTGISVNTTPDISKSTIFTTLQTQNIQSADLVITQNLLDECEYKLVWKVEYYKDSSKISWIDAHTGSILKTVDFEDNLNASTVTYSSQNLIDHSITSGGTTTTTLESPDQRISLFNFNTSCPKDPLDVTEWNTNLIPVTHSDHWGTEAAAEVYQAFFVISSVIPVYDGLGINFVKVNIGSCTGKNAASLIGSTTEETFIKIARINGTTAALHDAIAHELAHTYLHKFIDSDEPGNGSLHEGISDMLGTYVESVIQGNVDWVMGDDESVVANAVGRDLEHPGSQADCYLEVSSSEKHTRCKPLGFWYFLISQGGQNIPALGREKALNIVLDALSFLEMNADYHNLMQATINVAIDAYGPCSNEVLSITNAWETICVDTDWPKVNGVVTGCDYTIAGPSYVCEEDDGAEFCLSGGVPNVKYRFTIIGKKSTEYSSVCGMVGNSQEGDCECLNLTDFPDYPYYPQYITIELYCPWIGSHYIQRKRIKLVDCDNDDPSCEDYYNLNNLVNNKNEFKPISENLNDLLKPFHSSNKQLDQISENLKLRVVAFDLLGRTIYDGNAAEMRNNLKSYQGFLILVSYDEKGHIVKTMKTIFIN